MTLFQFNERRNGIMGDYMYHFQKAKEAKRKFVKRDLFMGFYRWKLYHHIRGAQKCLQRNKELEKAYFKEHYNYELGG